MEKMIGQISNEISKDELTVSFTFEVHNLDWIYIHFISQIPVAFETQSTQTENNLNGDKSVQTNETVGYWTNDEFVKTKVNKNYYEIILI